MFLADITERRRIGQAAAQRSLSMSAFIRLTLGTALDRVRPLPGRLRASGDLRKRKIQRKNP